MSGPVFDQRPGDLEATRQVLTDQAPAKARLRLGAQMGMREGKGVVVLLRGADSIATLDPTEAYLLAEAIAGIADIIGHRAREARD